MYMGSFSGGRDFGGKGAITLLEGVTTGLRGALAAALEDE